jgi:hypothetical protein
MQSEGQQSIQNQNRQSFAHGSFRPSASCDTLRPQCHAALFIFWWGYTDTVKAQAQAAIDAEAKRCARSQNSIRTTAFCHIPRIPALVAVVLPILLVFIWAQMLTNADVV